MRDLFSVAGKTALVTGGTSGIGRMIAEGLVAGGVVTYIVGRNAETCRATARELSAKGTCHPLVGDISTNAGIEGVVTELRQRADSLDILVNNAGAMYEAPIDEFTEEGWDSLADLNLKSVFFLTQKLLPMLRAAASEEDAASVVNIGSVGGLRVGPKENYSYQATKAGLHHLTGSLGKRLGPENITVNALAPGFFPSRLTSPDDVTPEILGMVPRRRMGTGDDVAGAVIYLASRAGNFVTGAVLPLDGGLTL